ncbi:hypothetical protein [Salmonirosea aquatica]|uniref:Uncharacterized protein n=1 Tax=Salmonirosea aquatica TaxID=2654236 RepID=A0A7C9BLN2_9BACT|nr:hypothetical protein [Cytophagaceae bacterium SJW1-29]MPR36943.1 hypothetical protein [Cytophagaceae bacterium SJW1-29]
MVYTTKIDLLGIVRGDSFELCVEIGEAFPLAGCTLRAQVRTYAGDYRVVLDLDVDTDLQHIILSAPAAAMRIAPGLYAYDVVATTAEGQEVTLFGGKFEIVNRVTR